MIETGRTLTDQALVAFRGNPATRPQDYGMSLG
jgi:hypothetical protein